MVDQTRSPGLARTAGGCVYAAHQSAGRHRRRALVPLHAVNRGRGHVPRTEKRTVHSAPVSSTGAGRQSSCDGRLRRLRFVGHAETSAEAPGGDSLQLSANEATNVQPFSAMKALALLSTLQSADIVLPTTDGREIRLRRITEPTPEPESAPAAA